MQIVLWLSLCLLRALSVSAGSVAKAATRDPRWERQWVAPRDGEIKLHIALRQDDNGARAEQKLLSIADPASPNFRQHLDSTKASYLATPGQGTVHAVEWWLAQHGLLRDSQLAGGIFEIDTTIRQAEKLLNTTYFYYSDGTNEVVRTERFYLPDAVNGHIDFVAPTTSFPRPARERVERRTDAENGDIDPQIDFEHAELDARSDCGKHSETTPTCVRQIYNIDYEAKPSRVTFAVYGTEAAKYSSSDLHTYLKKHNPKAAAAGADFTVIKNPNAAEGSGGIAAEFETALDTQTMMGLAWPAHGILFENGGVFGSKPGQTYDRFVIFLQELINNATVPSVVSFSESMPEDMMDPAYAKRLCNMMAQVGTRGVSLLFSSGDNGPNGDQPTGTHNAIFEPEFPASCPWVTAVGGTTDLANEKGATKSTIPASSIGYTASGGGFSNLFDTPKYQMDAVGNYTSKYVPESYSEIKSYNPNGSGIPDVSAFSTQFPTVSNGISVPIGGTSASTPLWAAIVTLLNDYEASKGRPALGFLNPWLYNLTSGLNDVTEGGNNKGSCGAGCTLKETKGYDVTKGWDPVTGLGSPNFAKLMKQLDKSAGG